MSGQALVLRNTEPMPRSDAPVLAPEAFRAWIVESVGAGARIAAFFGWQTAETAFLTAVLAADRAGELHAASCPMEDVFPSITPSAPQAHWFEREIAETWDVRPEGHPWLKPIRFQPPRRVRQRVFGDGRAPEIGRADFFRIAGEEIHEVAVGPVHAGVIEPGHFRFQCHGETVHHLEISLGYQHRGVERAITSGDPRRVLHYMETLCGDSSIAHATAYCRMLEGLAGCTPTPRAMTIRAVALELERLANHIGDLGALANDVGYLPTASYCGRIRGDVLNLTATICGNRFGRGLVRPGAAAWDIDGRRADDMVRRLEEIERDATGATTLLWETPSVMARFEDTGIVSRETCEAIGLVGPAARACGADRDVRKDFPFDLYRFRHIPSCTWDTGDVFARALVRWMEAQRSFAFVREQLQMLPAGEVRTPCGPAPADRLIVSLTEGWRGEVCHIGMTDSDGRLSAYKIVDPSFHNWFGLACALRGQPISDFPLCNKSFNLSYCGHDL